MFKDVKGAEKINPTVLWNCSTYFECLLLDCDRICIFIIKQVIQSH